MKNPLYGPLLCLLFVLGICILPYSFKPSPAMGQSQETPRMRAGLISHIFHPTPKPKPTTKPDSVDKIRNWVFNGACMRRFGKPPADSRWAYNVEKTWGSGDFYIKCWYDYQTHGHEYEIQREQEQIHVFVDANVQEKDDPR